MPTLVKTLPKFEDRLEAIEKKYHNAIKQAEKFTERLGKGERPGNIVRDVGAALYKAPVRNPVAREGAPEGYAITYYVIMRNQIYLLTMYSKNQQMDINTAELEDLVAAAEERHNA